MISPIAQMMLLVGQDAKPVSDTQAPEVRAACGLRCTACENTQSKVKLLCEGAAALSK